MKKIGLLCLALVLALGSLGVGYALWSDVLYIQGSVDTGNLCWEWTTVTQVDPGPPPQVVYDYHANPGFTGPPYIFQGDKDVGWTSAVVTDPKHITLHLYNVYPCYANEISLYTRNCGTVPLHFERVIFSSAYDTATIDWIALDYAPVSLDLTGDGNDDIEFKWGNHIGMQLHPNVNGPEQSFWLHILQACPQSQTGLTFTITLDGVQYNESIHPIPPPD